MRRMVTSVLVSVLLGGVTAAQLPPEILVDRYLLQAEQLRARKDHEAAVEMMSKIVAPQKEHELTLPGEFHFQYAQVAFSAGMIQTLFNEYEYPAQVERMMAETESHNGRSKKRVRLGLSMVGLPGPAPVRWMEHVFKWMRQNQYGREINE